MGYYINEDSKGKHVGGSFHEKISSLISDGAKKIDPPKTWKEGLVCAVNNGFFGALAYAYNSNEMDEFLIDDGREKQWLEFDKAKQLAK